MELKNLHEAVNKIELSEEMQERIIRNSYRKMEEHTMYKNKTPNFFKKPLLAIAAFALCLCLTSVTVMAATGKLQGFFKDITRWDGAVIGTTYEQATDEITLNTVSVSDELTITAEFVNPTAAPYRCLDTLGIKKYEIIDTNGKVVVKEKSAEPAEIIDGKVTFAIPVDALASGNYRLVVNKFVGNSKADQPLIINGTWECDFSR